MTTDLPLSGVKVLELASVLAGPFAGLLLRILGAEVVKIENPRGGDAIRRWGTRSNDTADGPMFPHLNAGKKSVALDLSDPASQAAVLRLLPHFDVLIASSRPGALERKGLGKAACLEANPNLVYASLSGFGSIGPFAERPAYDAVAQSLTGLLASYSVPGTTPNGLPTLGDTVAGIVLAMASLAGLTSVGRGRPGVVLETSLLEATLALMNETYARPDSRADFESTRVRHSLIFQLETSDTKQLTVHLSNSDRYWSALVSAVDNATLRDARFSTYGQRMTHFDELDDHLRAAFVERPLAYWAQRLAECDVPFAPVLQPGEAVKHPQVLALDMFEDVDGSAKPLQRGPWRVNGTRPSIGCRAPVLGEHTDEVLGWLKPSQLPPVR